jgi:hypothetical protein
MVAKKKHLPAEVDSQLLTTEEVARLLRMQPQSLRAQRQRRRSPIPYIRIGDRHVLYRLSDVQRYLAEHEVRR